MCARLKQTQHTPNKNIYIQPAQLFGIILHQWISHRHSVMQKASLMGQRQNEFFSNHNSVLENEAEKGAKHQLRLQRIHALTSMEDSTIPRLEKALSDAHEQCDLLRGALSSLRNEGQVKMKELSAKAAGMEKLMREMMAEREEWRKENAALIKERDVMREQLDRVRANRVSEADAVLAAANASNLQATARAPARKLAAPVVDAATQTTSSQKTPRDVFFEGIANLLVFALIPFVVCADGSSSFHPAGWLWGTVAVTGGRAHLRYVTCEGWHGWYATTSGAVQEGREDNLLTVESFSKLLYDFALDASVRRALGNPADVHLLAALIASLWGRSHDTGGNSLMSPCGAADLAFLQDLRPPTTPWPALDDLRGQETLIAAVCASSLPSASTSSPPPPSLVVGMHADGTSVLITAHAPMGREGHVFCVTAFDPEVIALEGGRVLTSWLPFATLVKLLVSYRVVGGVKSHNFSSSSSLFVGDGAPPPSIILLSAALISDMRGGPSHAYISTDVWLDGPREILPPSSVVAHTIVAHGRLSAEQFPDAPVFPMLLVRRGNHRFALKSSELLHWYASQYRSSCEVGVRASHSPPPASLALTVCLYVKSQLEWRSGFGAATYHRSSNLERSGNASVGGLNDSIEEVTASISAISFVKPVASPSFDSANQNDASDDRPIFWPLKAQVNGQDRFTSTVVISDSERLMDGADAISFYESETNRPSHSDPTLTLRGKSFPSNMMREFMEAQYQSLARGAPPPSPILKRLTPNNTNVSPSRQRKYSSPSRDGGKGSVVPATQALHGGTRRSSWDMSRIDEAKVLRKAHGTIAARRRWESMRVSVVLASHGASYVAWLDACSSLFTAHQSQAAVLFAAAAATVSNMTAMLLWSHQAELAATCIGHKVDAFSDEVLWRLESELYVANALRTAASEWSECALTGSYAAMEEKMDLVAENVSPQLAISYFAADAADDMMQHCDVFIRSVVRWCEGVALAGLAYNEHLMWLQEPFIDEAQHARRILDMQGKEGGSDSGVMMLKKYSDLIRDHQLAVDRSQQMAREVHQLRMDLEDAVKALLDSQSMNQQMRRRFAQEMTQRDVAIENLTRQLHFFSV